MADCTDRTIRSKPLYEMFNAVPRRYDRVNHVITLGLDTHWRLMAAGECLASRPSKVLDLCCGPGELALNVMRLADYDVEVVGLDYSRPMLDIAAKKAAPLARKPSFVQGEAADMPFPNEYFDCTGISFAFRNLTYKNPLVHCHVAEILRVLRPEGRLVIVESSQPTAKLIRMLFHLYLRGFVFRMGSVFSGNKGAYHYLAESAARYYTSMELKEMLLSAGFRQVSFRPLFFGAAGIHVAIK